MFNIRFYLMVLCLFSFSQPLLAKEVMQGNGKVNVQGSITDAACAIAVESRDQSINIGVIPLADIYRDGQGEGKEFSIKLINCLLEHPSGRLQAWKQFQVVFDGNAEGSLFNVQGGVTGVALRITDKFGNVAYPGKPLPLVDIQPGNMLLNYDIRLVANQRALKAGDYSSSIRFKLDYF
ncbi:fimbrial protein [Serratia liquefaciens]|uniref:fimbrial protein n=1 Tax=Serratia liquefaciens TaxID=614 RepID=UPI00236098A1|nr:fimbrial protein [Serratia liquefaciens]